MKNDIRIKNINQVIDIGVALGNFCFRGHQEIVKDGSLLPKVFRNLDFTNEKHFIQEFIRYGRIYANDFPNNNVEILFLMQHYGLPTRLLDWSENILVALFFAVIDKDDSDGELWILNPSFLNSITIKDFNYQDVANDLLNEPFDNSIIKIDKKIENPIMIWPRHFDKRMIAQQSVFTIHNKDSKKITDIVKSNRDIERLIIPKKMKTIFRWNLYELGISERILFPDLEGLAKDIYRNKNYGRMNQVTGFSIKSIL